MTWPKGRARFSELERSLCGISPRTLSIRLRSLEEEGIIERREFSEMPPRVEYRLTAKGSHLVPIVDAMRRTAASSSSPTGRASPPRCWRPSPPRGSPRPARAQEPQRQVQGVRHAPLQHLPQLGLALLVEDLGDVRA